MVQHSIELVKFMVCSWCFLSAAVFALTYSLMKENNKPQLRPTWSRNRSRWGDIVWLCVSWENTFLAFYMRSTLNLLPALILSKNVLLLLHKWCVVFRQGNKSMGCVRGNCRDGRRCNRFIYSTTNNSYVSNCLEVLDYILRISSFWTT